MMCDEAQQRLQSFFSLAVDKYITAVRFPAVSH